MSVSSAGDHRNVGASGLKISWSPAVFWSQRGSVVTRVSIGNGAAEEFIIADAGMTDFSGPPITTRFTE